MSNDLATMIRQKRAMRRLTLSRLSEMSGVSASHLGRIERGERFPSAHILRKIAQPLDSEESELLILADYLSPQSSGAERPSVGQLDPYVSAVLSQEPVEMQRTLVTILIILKSMAKITQESVVDR